MKMMIVKFIAAHPPYNVGETAGFEAGRANELIRQKKAVELGKVKNVEPVETPKEHVEKNVDDMTLEEVKAFLGSNRVQFHPNASEEKLREKARGLQQK